MPLLNILLVEDDPDQSELWAGSLRNYGHRVIQVASGVSAVTAVAAADSNFDAVLMDITLDQQMNGVEAAARIRIFNPHLPVIFMSAHSDGDTLEQAKLALPAGYLVKPFRFHQLLEALEKGVTRVMPENSADHDLLVRLDVKLDLVSVQLNEARSLMNNKADTVAVEKRIVELESQVKNLTKTMYMILGGLILLEAVLKFVIK